MTKAPINLTDADRKDYLKRLSEVYKTKLASSEKSFVWNRQAGQ